MLSTTEIYAFDAVEISKLEKDATQARDQEQHSRSEGGKEKEIKIACFCLEFESSCRDTRVYVFVVVHF